MTTQESTLRDIDISSDVSETRRIYLGGILVLCFVAVTPLVAITAGIWYVFPFLVGCFIALLLHGIKRPKVATWATLINLQAMPLTWLYLHDNSVGTTYYLMLIPMILAGLLLESRQQIAFSILSLTGMALVAISNKPHPEMVMLLIIAAIVISELLARTVYADSFHGLAGWALEAQTKSERRSKMYYEQREQLQEALHNLTIANFQLEEMNIKLDEARQQAEQANAVKSMFLASMSHELRTPLNSILNFSQFMLNGVMGDVTDKQVEALTYINTSGKHLLSLINDVLDISKIEAGALELFVEDDVNIAEELDIILKTGESLLSEKPVKIQVEVDKDLPLIVGDRQRIFQIVMNLVSNACKFTQEGTITLKANRRNGSVIVAVQDSGPGIAPDEQEAVFETFRQTKRGFSAGGTGLGLPISRRLAEAHGGQLWLESTPGHGATFFVELPVRSSDLLVLMHEKADE